VLHFAYEDMIQAFAEVGIDARFGEDTPNAECAAKVRAWGKLGADGRERVGRRLLAIKSSEVSTFVGELRAAITRQIAVIRVLPLHGRSVERDTVEAAIKYIERYDEAADGRRPLAKYEVQVRYSNGDQVNAVFSAKGEAIAFLRSFQPAIHPATPTDDPD
jgi:hypothetical protein